MWRIKETLEYYDSKTNEVVKEKHHYLDKKGYFTWQDEDDMLDVFKMCVESFLKDRKDSVAKKNEYVLG